MIDLTSLGRVSSGYGKRNTGIQGASTNHKGVDIVLTNKNVPAAVGGTVTTVGYSSARGNYIQIAQDDGTHAIYQHLAQRPTLASGTRIQAGQTIGIMGNTGVGSGAHLHYEVWRGGANTPYAQRDYIDPRSYLKGGVSSTPAQGLEAQGASQNPLSSTGIGSGIASIVTVLVICLAILTCLYFIIKGETKRVFSSSTFEKLPNKGRGNG